MAWGLAVRSGSGISSISPSVEILPIWPAAISTNHKAEPSVVMPPVRCLGWTVSEG